MRSHTFEQRAFTLYSAALDVPTLERDDWLVAAAGADAALLEAVQALAHADRAAGALPTRPPGPAGGDDAAAPDRIADYRIVRELGRGGMGVVYLGERDDGLFDHRVAIKLVRTQAVSARAREQFDKERRILARLRHPHIAQMFDGGLAADGTSFIVMEHIAGKPITSHCEQADLDLPARLALFRQAASAIEYAHRNLIVHADVKPSNVVVEEGFGVKLLDFGIAQLMDDIEAHAPIGYTPGYASPQRVAGEPAKPADDVYAAGVLLGALVAELPDCDADLRSVVSKAAADDTAQRYGTIGDIVTDLTRWEEHRPVSAVAPTRVHRARLAWRRHRLAISLVSAALLGLCLVLGIVSQLYLRSEHARRLADQRFNEARGMADYLIEDVDPQLAQLAGALPIRKELATRTGRYLHTLESDPAAATMLQRDIAAAYMSLARIDGFEPSGGIGDFAAGRRNLARAQALLAAEAKRDPGNVSLMLQRARADIIAGSAVFVSPDAGDVSRGMAALARARSVLQSYLRQRPGDLRARLDLWRAEGEMARGYNYLDRPGDAEAIARAGLSNASLVFTNPADRRERDFLLDASYLLLGETLQDDDPAQASDYYSRLIDNVAAMQARGEADWQNEFLQVSAFGDRGSLLLSANRRDAAIADFRRSIAAAGQLLAHGGNHEIAMYQNYVRTSLASVLSAKGELGEARALSDAALAWLAKDVAGGSETSSKRLLAMALGQRGTIEQRGGDDQAACRFDTRAVRTWRELERSGDALPGDRAPGALIPSAVQAQAKACRG